MDTAGLATVEEALLESTRELVADGERALELLDPAPAPVPAAESPLTIGKPGCSLHCPLTKVLYLARSPPLGHTVGSFFLIASRNPAFLQRHSASVHDC